MQIKHPAESEFIKQIHLAIAPYIIKYGINKLLYKGTISLALQGSRCTGCVSASVYLEIDADDIKDELDEIVSILVENFKEECEHNQEDEYNYFEKEIMGGRHHDYDLLVNCFELEPLTLSEYTALLA